MIERIIRASSQRPLLTAICAFAAALAGALVYPELRKDVFPDLSTPVFNVIVQNPAMGAEELEATIAIPLENALAGLPGTRRMRSRISFVCRLSQRSASSARLRCVTSRRVA